MSVLGGLIGAAILLAIVGTVRLAIKAYSIAIYQKAMAARGWVKAADGIHMEPLPGTPPEKALRDLKEAKEEINR